jgi:hypothetical protein
VCRATGESRDIIRRLGFQEIPMPRVIFIRRNFTPRPQRRQHSVNGRN